MCFSHDAKDGGLGGGKGGAQLSLSRECSTAATLAVQVAVGPDFDNRNR
jgi:hypothetical protein